MLDNPKQFLASLPNRPGVYQMYADDQQILYVGKAKNLKKRVTSYFRAVSDPKTKIFMAQVKRIEIIVTPSENAALLLESNLIKTKKPRYNILFKDDKSFPYILLSRHDFPRLSVYRGAVKRELGKYFGPFPDRVAVNFVLDLLQKIFQLRVCKDSFMRNRSRPCMLYQIKLCGAPCVGCIDQATYALQVKLVERFLSNQSDHVVQELTRLMDRASANLAYEQAANYRDQIISIRRIQSEQAITQAQGNCDVIALVTEGNSVCINLLFIRNGLVIGNKTYFPAVPDRKATKGEILAAFMMHYYLQDRYNLVVPDKILLNLKLPSRLQIAEVLSEKFGQCIIVSDQTKGAQRQLLIMAEANANNALENHQKITLNYAKCWLDFKEVMRLAVLPKRIECFDVSHTMGEAGVVSCVVFDERGPSKKDYRRFNLGRTRAGDDYGALREGLFRRLHEAEELPEVIVIDGGLGQLGVGVEVLRSLQLTNILLIAIAKGVTRKPGLEEIYVGEGKEQLVLPPDSPALHFMQMVRDEAHRFAISGHRKRMVKSRRRSELENIPGIGKAKRTWLLKHFGGVNELRSVGIAELARVKGVGRNLAERIYEYLHGKS